MKKLLTSLICLGLAASVVTAVQYSPVMADGESQKTELKESNIAFTDENGNRISSLTIAEDEKKSIFAQLESPLQWQIQVSDNLWVDIRDAKDRELEVSKPLIENVMDSKSIAKVRVEYFQGDTTFASKSFAVKLKNSEEGKTEDQKNETPVFDVLSEAKAESVNVEEPVSDPAENINQKSDEECAQDDPELNFSAEEENQNPEPEVQEEVQQEEIAAAAGQNDGFELEGQETEVLPRRISNIYFQETTEYIYTIEYLFKGSDGNDIQIAAPYVARLAPKSSFKTTVTSPVVRGYQPVKGFERVTFDNPSVEADQTIQVYYEASAMNFTLNIYQQNVENDQYTQLEPEAIEGRTDAQVRQFLQGKLPEYEGFTRLAFDDTVTVAADGSTQVDVYYDRNYSLVLFDLDGGTGTNPEYGKFGAVLNPNTPSKAGFTFNGWLDSENQPIDFTNGLVRIGSENKTYKAKWLDVDKAEVKVLFWGRNPSKYISDNVYDSDTGYSYLGSTTKDTNKINLEVDYNSLYDQQICTKADHIHTETCFPGIIQALDSMAVTTNSTSLSDFGSKWDFESSSTTVISSDGSSIINVYLKRKLYNVNLYTKAWLFGKKTIVMDVTLPWGTDISKQYLNVAAKNGYDWRKELSFSDLDFSGFVESTMYLSTVPVGNLELGARIYQGSSSKTITYFIEKDDDELEEDSTTKYKVLVQPSINADFVTEVSDKQFIEIPGYVLNKTDSAKIKESIVDAEFYYDRKPVKLQLENCSNKTGISGFYKQRIGSLIDNTHFVPIPKAGQENAVVFDGWYYNPDCSDEAAVDLENDRLDENGAILFAKWVPVIHLVEIYTDSSCSTKLSGDLGIPHGSSLGESLQDPTPPEDAEFISWFYKDDNGIEHAFHNSMQVLQDLKLYPKWKFENKLETYIIQYIALDEKGNELKDEAGNPVKVAKDETVSVLHGSNKTVEAKTGAALISDGVHNFQKGYFPTVNSQNVPPLNGEVVTFKYKPIQQVKYRVEYLEAEPDKNGIHKPVDGLPAEEFQTSDAVVTPRYKYVEGLKPDNVSKRLILSADESKNLIQFFYSVDEKKEFVPVEVEYYQESLYGNGTKQEYNLVSKTESMSSKANDVFQVALNSYPGFESPIIEVAQGTETEIVKPDEAGGVKITLKAGPAVTVKLYYNRKTYPYSVHYVNIDNDNAPVADSISVDAKYGSTHHIDSIKIDGYQPLEEDGLDLTIDMNDENDLTKNSVIFRYTENTADISYQVAVPEGESSDGLLNSTRETPKVMTGTAQGSTNLNSNPRLKFAGWYSDEACTTPVSDSAAIVENGSITPKKTKTYKSSLKNQSDRKGYENITFYAKYELNVGSLRINKVTDDQSNRAFIFEIKKTDSEDQPVYITVNCKNGSGSATVKNLIVGNYTIRELTDWNYGYSIEGKSSKDASVSAAETQTVEFSNKKSARNWLSGFADWQNSFKKGAGK